ncbi:hypothetical protein K435DRAFT_770153 [Dendrothele bispora CBS 962.96]|uniref:Uncharacterized protein n=1 Tax=Dendrothele bispora (strain CBS 962.96) TaxID=1314807 RepID=A0A4S8KQD3_DENBC|nr:hypothetical protein K435DRAFT_770153 [Dendrothele bispora CBS 962.96]
MSCELTPKEVRRAARAAISIFEENDYDCCLFGSLACHIFGMRNRDPEDVDLIVLNSGELDAEDLKQLLVDSCRSRFHLEDPPNPNAPYQILYYRVPTYGPRAERKFCKIDILVTGKYRTKLQIPRAPNSRIMYVEPYEDIPVMPLLALLGLKLQGWYDNSNSRWKSKRRKAVQDAEDVDQLLEIAVEQECHLENWDEKWIPGWFREKVEMMLEEYKEEFPDSEENWSELGFD